MARNPSLKPPATAGRALSEKLAVDTGAVLDAYEKSLEARGTGPTQLQLVRRLHSAVSGVPVGVLDANAALSGSDSTKRRQLGVLIAALNHAVKIKLIEPGARPHIELPPTGQPREVYLGAIEEAQFWRDAVSGAPLSRVGRFVAVALDTGARRQAIHDLTWDRVSFVTDTIDFRTPGQRVTKKRRVPVPIAKRLRPVLDQAYYERKDNFVLGEGDFRTTWETWRAQHPEWAHVTPHVLRHTFATLRAQKGVPMWELSGVLGDTIETTTRNYLHHNPDHLRSAVEL